MPKNIGRAATWLAALVASLGVTPSPGSSRGEAAVQAPLGTPTARVCAVHDFGTPLPNQPSVVQEPYWFPEVGGVVQSADGSLYTTSQNGGVASRGTVFKVDPVDGKVTVLTNFDLVNPGAGAQGGLTDGHDGYFYGTTYSSGKFGGGTLFRISSSGGSFQTLYQFRNGSVYGLVPPCANRLCPFSPRQRADAAASYPISAPVRAQCGTLYGVTTYSNNQGFGVLYSMSPPYDTTSFHALCIFDPRMLADKDMAPFVCSTKATYPSSVTLGGGGRTLYGTTLGAYGTVFASTLGGSIATLHTFNFTDGSKPFGVTQASDGKLYGTTANGGDINVGVVYRLDPSTGAFEILSSMHNGPVIAGVNPVGGLIEGKDSTGKSDGFLYGTTKYGGVYGRGIVYRISMTGQNPTLDVLHNFLLYATGRYAQEPLMQHRNGKFYGFTYQGGRYDHGALYSLSEVNSPRLTTHESTFSPGIQAKGDDGSVLSTGMYESIFVDIHTDVTASQPPSPIIQLHGIAVRLRCRNPHLIQFISREALDAKLRPIKNPDGTPILMTVTGADGNPLSYPTSIVPDTVWRTDSETGRPNAYVDQAPYLAHSSYIREDVTLLTIWDHPAFTGWQAGQTWRATAKVFAICNCGVEREIHWTLEKTDAGEVYKGMSIQTVSNTALPYINAQLAKDKFRPVP